MIKFELNKFEISNEVKKDIKWLLKEFKSKNNICKCLKSRTIKVTSMVNSATEDLRESRAEFYCRGCNSIYFAIYKNNRKTGDYDLGRTGKIVENYDIENIDYQDTLMECGLRESMIKIDDRDKTILINSVEYSDWENKMVYSYIFK